MENYYDYENDILNRLSKTFKFDSISVNQDNYTYDYYNNQPITLSTYDDKYLILNFKKSNFININNIKKILYIKKKEFYPISNKKYLYMIKGTLKSMNINIK